MAAHDYLRMLTKILKLAVAIATAFYGVADSFLSLVRARRSCPWEGLRFSARGVEKASRNILLASAIMRLDKRAGKITIGGGACAVSGTLQKFFSSGVSVTVLS